jgi:amino-acid N-acetyltransferase
MAVSCRTAILYTEWNAGIDYGENAMEIIRASGDDLEDVLKLLSTVELPHDGVSHYFAEFFVMRAANGNLLACGGLERHGELALLRSVAVRPDSHRVGLGAQIATAILDEAARNSIRTVVLLTTTARDFFAQKFGFVKTTRSEFEPRLKNSPEWNLPRCSSAVVMKLDLTDYAATRAAN